ncbi:SusD/RagB family nutrient-binding outer membrane lipoprotein [Sphingobacteriaceae bacterium WQ 2009]|uniref:SusD/RagB family nutrient-binding outer membrane lipoprotein n=1 Tax=Rhinopithecimicrobium faecis TaxID=2820698 RepID=A0A8T4HA36_9SPHI|nr:SusD/RagB family nutrient-binding outer membrane lipoprotein [Sphingobacteriaceae bacterium WQ 2009]
MKNIISKIALALALTASLSGCKKFEEINTSPTAANEDQVQIEYFINNAITGAQQDPNIAERVFVLYWKTAGRQHFTTGIAGGTNNDDWSREYWSYSANWLNAVNTGIQIAEKQVGKGNGKTYTNNLIQISRIWRAYLISELSDNFGPLPIVAFEGVNPQFNSVKDIYYYLLDELKDATAKMDENAIPNDLGKFDPAYKFNTTKWKKYANSMRMRLAMRLSEVDAAKAKTEFEAAVATKLFITDAADNFTVAEKPGWDALTGVMSREWNSQGLSATLNNLYLGLGGVKSADQLGAAFQSQIKPADYIGKRFTEHFSSMTNDPSAGYWLDGLPNAIDPRAYKAFFIPGDITNSNFSSYPSWTNDAKTTKAKLIRKAGDIEIDAKYTWNSFAVGDWGAKGTANQLRTTIVGKIPGLSQDFRASQSSRIFFANWESYFLLAEAAVRGWNSGTTAQAAYENGVRANFTYWKVSQFADAYLGSDSYNRAGTSAKFTHTAEPSASVTMKYVDGYTGTEGTTSFTYPTNNLYKNGTVKNDQLTKIITQKYIANMPWLPLESWNDQRRLGLPFFENPAIENPLTNLPDLTASNYKTSNIKFFPQRLPYPSSFREADNAAYQQAVTLLGGEDRVLTPLWWAKK